MSKRYYVKVDLGTSKVLEVSETPLRSEPGKPVLVVDNLETTDPDKLYVIRDPRGVIVVRKIDDPSIKKELLERELERERRRLLSKLAKEISNYILFNYPDLKQKSDIIDKEFYSSKLLEINSKYTLDKIYKNVKAYATSIATEEKKLEEIISSLPEAEQEAWEQLIKVALRIGWVEQVKKVYRELKSEINSAPDFETLGKVEAKIEQSLPTFPKA